MSLVRRRKRLPTRRPPSKTCSFSSRHTSNSMDRADTQPNHRSPWTRRVVGGKGVHHPFPNQVRILANSQVLIPTIISTIDFKSRKEGLPLVMLSLFRRAEERSYSFSCWAPPLLFVRLFEGKGRSFPLPSVSKEVLLASVCILKGPLCCRPFWGGRVLPWLLSRRLLEVARNSVVHANIWNCARSWIVRPKIVWKIYRIVIAIYCSVLELYQTSIARYCRSLPNNFPYWIKKCIGHQYYIVLYYYTWLYIFTGKYIHQSNISVHRNCQ